VKNFRHSPERTKSLGRIPAGHSGKTPSKACFCNLFASALHSALRLSDKIALEKTVFGRGELNKSVDL
jgi:hypothetical protein